MARRHVRPPLRRERTSAPSRRRTIAMVTALAAATAVTVTVVPAVTTAAAAGTLPNVTVRTNTAAMTNITGHTGITRTATCPTGTLVGGGGYLRNATDPTTLPTNGLVLGATSPSTGASPVDQVPADGTADLKNWMAYANFTGVAEVGDQATAFALCATGGPSHTVVATNSTVGANALQQVAAPILTIATCPVGTTLIGGGAVTGTPDQVQDGTTVGNNGNLKPLGNYPSDSTGAPATNGSTGATSWSAYGSAGITTANDKVTAIALCTSDPITVTVARADTSGPDAQVGTTIIPGTATCPVNTQMLGGGYRTDETVNGTAGLQPQQGYHMRGSYPSLRTGNPPIDLPDGSNSPRAWSALVQAGGQNLPMGSSMQMHTYAMCAQPTTSAPTTTTTHLDVTPDSPTAAGTQETLDATVSPSATGTVQFLDGTTPIGNPVPTHSSSASTTVTLTPGNHSLTAAFTPTDPTAFTSSTSDAVAYTVNAAATTTTQLAVTPASPAPSGTQETLTATVSPAAAGIVQFFDGTTPIGDPVGTNGATASTTTTLAQGNHSLTAAFTSTDPAYADSTSDAVPYTVNAPAATTTTTQLGVTPASPAPSGTQETLTATVSPTAAAGTVQFLDGTTPLGNPVTVTGGNASTTVTLAQGNHSLTAAFTPADPTAFTSSTSDAVPYTVNAPAATPTTTQLGVTPASPAPSGTRETLTAMIVPAAPGTVQFRDGTTPVGGPVTVNGGIASTSTVLAQGNHSLTATFTPADPTQYAGSTSNAVPYTVNAPARADIGVSLRAQPAAGRAFAVTVTTTNSGPSTALEVFTTVVLPNGLRAVAAPGGAIAPDGRTVVYRTASLAASRSVTATVSVIAGPPARGNQTIGAGALSFYTPDPALRNNTAATTVRVS